MPPCASLSLLAGVPLCPVSLSVGTAVFAAATVLLNSRLGMYLEEVGTDSLVRTGS